MRVAVEVRAALHPDRLVLGEREGAGGAVEGIGERFAPGLGLAREPGALAVPQAVFLVALPEPPSPELERDPGDPGRVVDLASEGPGVDVPLFA